MHEIITDLKALGCSEREARIYLDLCISGGASVQTIATRLRENRVTVHSAIERLLEKGYLSETRDGKRRLVVAEQPHELRYLLEAKRNELVEQEQRFESLLRNLSQIPRQEAKEPSVRIYKGTSGLKRLLDETLSSRGELRVAIDVGRFLSLLSKSYLKRYYEQRAKRGISSRLIWPNHPFVHEMQPLAKSLRMDIRVSQRSDRWEAGFFVWDDTFAMKSLAEGFLTCTIIRSKEIAEFYRTTLFDPLWHTLPKIEETRQRARRKRRSQAKGESSDH